MKLIIILSFLITLSYSKVVTTTITAPNAITTSNESKKSTINAPKTTSDAPKTPTKGLNGGNSAPKDNTVSKSRADKRTSVADGMCRGISGGGGCLLP